MTYPWFCWSVRFLFFMFSQPPHLGSRKMFWQKTNNTTWRLVSPNTEYHSSCSNLNVLFGVDSFDISRFWRCTSFTTTWAIIFKQNTRKLWSTNHQLSVFMGLEPVFSIHSVALSLCHQPRKRHLIIPRVAYNQSSTIDFHVRIHIRIYPSGGGAAPPFDLL